MLEGTDGRYFPSGLVDLGYLFFREFDITGRDVSSDPRLSLGCRDWDSPEVSVMSPTSNDVPLCETTLTHPFARDQANKT